MKRERDREKGWSCDSCNPDTTHSPTLIKTLLSTYKKTSEISSCSSSIFCQSSRFLFSCSITGSMDGKAELKLLNNGTTTSWKNPHWLFVIPALSLSMRGDFVRAPNSSSLSPWAKNSCSNFCTHFRCTFERQYT